jgi:hypothetical protein
MRSGFVVMAIDSLQGGDRRRRTKKTKTHGLAWRGVAWCGVEWADEPDEGWGWVGGVNKYRGV